MSDFVINKVHRKTLNQIVYENIKNSIMNGEIKPGTKLAEVNIARQMSVSPTPVREAFRMLATEGLVKIEPWKGAVVQLFSSDEETDCIQCRCALELLAFDLWFPHRTPEELLQLDGIVGLSLDMQSNLDFESLNSQLHNVWIGGAQNQRLRSLLNHVKDAWIHEHAFTLLSAENQKQAINEHAILIGYIKDAQLEQARNCLRNHILIGCND